MSNIINGTNSSIKTEEETVAALHAMVDDASACIVLALTSEGKVAYVSKRSNASHVPMYQAILSSFSERVIDRLVDHVQKIATGDTDDASPN